MGSNEAWLYALIWDQKSQKTPLLYFYWVEIVELTFLAFAEPFCRVLDFYLQKTKAAIYILSLVFAESVSLSSESVTFGRWEQSLTSCVSRFTFSFQMKELWGERQSWWRQQLVGEHIPGWGANVFPSTACRGSTTDSWFLSVLGNSYSWANRPRKVKSAVAAFLAPKLLCLLYQGSVSNGAYSLA